jgi:hypothetical protein
MIGTSRSGLLDSCYFENQTWGALHKAWKGYVIAKNKVEIDRLYYYAEVIQKLQRELGLPVSLFPSLGLSPQELADDASEDYHSEEFDRGLKKGNISNTFEEAIEMWIAHVANVYRKMSGKTEIKRS